MKYLLLVPDGMADDPLDDLGGKTPLQAAKTPCLDDLARKGTVGAVQVTPAGMYPGSDAANMALLGYDPVAHYSGRGPIEAAALGVPMDSHDVAFRCSLVTVDGEKLLDYSSGHVASKDARQLIELADRKLCTQRMRLYPGVSYRHILVWGDGPVDMETFPPHEHIGEPIADLLPRGDGEAELRRLMWDSLDLLDNQPYNKRRRDEGKAPANMLWPWSQGRTPSLPSFAARHGKTGAVVAAVDVVKGLGRLVGLDVLDVPGATGFFDTDYASKARVALAALDRYDFVWIHVEAPDEAGHIGSIDEKIRAIQNVDTMLGTVMDGLRKLDHCRVLVTPDHHTPITTRGHRAGFVPYLLFDSRSERSNGLPYDERAVQETRAPHVDEGYRLIDELFGKG